MLPGEATNTNCIVFRLTRPGLEPRTIYRTQGEHANHYATEARGGYRGGAPGARPPPSLKLEKIRFFCIKS